VYQSGDAVEFTVSFNEVVRVDVSEGSGLPTLSLSSGGELLPVVASYAGGSGTKALKFRYEVAEGDPVASGLNVASFNFNGGRVTDIIGNVADVALTSGQNDLPSSVSITVDGLNTLAPTALSSNAGVTDMIPATIESVSVLEGDGTYQAGDKLTLRVGLSESVVVDAANGIPMLILSNGGVTAGGGL
jgi:hypothetical protein